MSIVLPQKVDEFDDVIDLDELHDLALQLNNEDETVRPAVLCNIVD